MSSFSLSGSGDEPELFPSSSETAPRKRGRPPGSSKKPSTAADLLRSSAGFEATGDVFLEIVGGSGRPPASAGPDFGETVGTSPEFEAMLAEAEFDRFGNAARSLLVFVQDVSPSEKVHEPQWLAGAPEVASELQKSPLARNQVDVAHICGAEQAEVRSFAHGDFMLPGSIRYGRSTCCLPWLMTVMQVIVTYERHLRGRGIAMREGLVVFASDFHFSDFDPAELDRFKTACSLKRQVVLAAMFGEANVQVAGQFSAPIPPVDLKRVPLGLFIRELARTTTRSLARNMPLEEMLAQAIRAILNPVES